MMKGRDVKEKTHMGHGSKGAWTVRVLMRLDGRIMYIKLAQSFLKELQI